MLTKNCLRKNTLTAEEDTEIFALGAKDSERVLGSSLAAIITRNKVKAKLLHYEEFRVLSSAYIDLALDCFKIQNFEIVLPNL